jgi:hypothetical protein
MREPYRHMKPSESLVKAIVALLALLAVSAALAGPICDAFELPDDAHPESCCTSLNDRAPVPPVAASFTFEPPSSVPLPGAWPANWRAVTWPGIAIPADRPQLTRPYYARSARILS